MEESTNLERALDHLLGSPIAEALLSGVFKQGQVIHSVASNDQIILR